MALLRVTLCSLLATGLLFELVSSFVVERKRSFSLNSARSMKQYGDLSDEERNERKSSKTFMKKSSQGSFATGKELVQLREDLRCLRENLQWAEATEDELRTADLRQAIESGENRDPDIVYERALRKIHATKLSTMSAEKKQEELKKLQDQAQQARKHLKRFQLDGLWVGSYGERGEQLVNVTYIGDTMIATKVTGDVNVPRGETSFTANLAPQNSSALEPLKVSFDRQSPTELPRYPGKGQIAKAGFQENKYVEGQFVLFENHFSFVWIPSRHHVLFRRPTPSQTIELMRDDISKEDELENMRDHLSRCFEMDMTESIARFHADVGPEPFRRIPLANDLKSLQQPLEPESTSPLSFFKMQSWRSYFDKVLGDERKKRKD